MVGLSFLFYKISKYFNLFLLYSACCWHAWYLWICPKIKTSLTRYFQQITNDPVFDHITLILIRMIAISGIHDAILRYTNVHNSGSNKFYVDVLHDRDCKLMLYEYTQSTDILVFTKIFRIILDKLHIIERTNTK